MQGRGIAVAAGDVLLGKYRVERLLGKGGMGIVLAARHIDLDELFAIKLMHDAEASAEADERFLREARAAAKLKGEHVARVQDVGRLPDGTPYMVMEYLEGSDLRRVLKSRGPLPWREAVTYILQACETLSEAHSLGIIHRDVKPANIFLTRRRNGSPCVKVLDFGISKHTRGDAVALTITSTVGGSPLYMSPEQMRSAKHVDGRTDIWSLGVVLHELLTATSPFAAETITAVTSRVLQDEPAPPSLVVRDVPRSVDSVVLRCLAKRPEDRFSNMDELIATLRAALAGDEATVSPIAEVPTMPLARGSLASIAEPATAVPGRTGTPLSMGMSASAAAPSTGMLAPPSPELGSPSSGSRGPGSTSAFVPTSITQPLRPTRPNIALLAVLGVSAVAGVVMGILFLFRPAADPGSPADPAAVSASAEVSAEEATSSPPPPTVEPAPLPATTGTFVAPDEPTAAAAPSATARSAAPTTATQATSPPPASPKQTASKPPAAAPKPGPTATTGKKRRTID